MSNGEGPSRSRGGTADDPLPGWFALATSGPVVRRSLVFFFLVGGALIGINHGDALLRGDVDGVRLVKMILTPLVPYLVSTYSSVAALRESLRRDAARAETGPDEGESKARGLG